MQMPHNGFDNLAALARLNYDDTSHHRERWPTLDWVWDELDELRRWQDEAIEAERDALSEVAEQRDALSEAVRLLLEPEPDMEHVQAVLAGGCP
jgi:hypothetical protein